MDLAAATTTTTTTTQINPDAKNETPPHIQPIKSLSFTNGALKGHHHHHLTAPPPPASVTYKECLKNHAASLGGHALDGCGEFMPSPTATDPTSLKCAACGCHRNFHRRDPDEPNPALFLDFRPHPPPPPPPRRTLHSPSNSPPPPSSYYSSAPHNMLLALSTAVAEDHPKKTHRQFLTPATVKMENPIGRKRFRSKFNQDQKDKMFSFSEKMGWKMQKCDEALVEKFCNEIGVRKGVLKVWMHNNKHNFVKRSDINISNGHNNNSHDDHHMEDSGVHLHVSTNGSSSSSRSVERESEGELEREGKLSNDING